MTQHQALQVLKSGKNVFLTGEPGSGKTYTINQFSEYLRNEKFIYPSITASTGIAATHINGTTIHSWCGIGIKEELTERDIELILNKGYILDRLQMAQVLVIDEVSMLSDKLITNVDRICSAARNNPNQPFGGLQVIFVGDFFQLPPVNKIRGKSTGFAFESQSWIAAKPETCYLTEQHRTEDPEFLEILTALRNETLTKAHIERIKECGKRTAPKNEKITRLFTHNRDVDNINSFELSKLPGKEEVFEMRSDGIPFLVDWLKRNCLSPEKLRLKIGALVMFTRNNFDIGYVNGTIGEVVRFTDDGNVIVRTKSGEELLAMAAEWSIDEKAYIRQIPLRLAWAITVHKSQGMSLDAATVDLSGAFEYGQGYVALSRVRSLKGLYIEGLNAQALKMHPRIVEQDKIFRQA